MEIHNICGPLDVPRIERIIGVICMNPITLSFVLSCLLSAASFHSARPSVAAKEAFGAGWERRWKCHTPENWKVEREAGKPVLRMTMAGVPPKEIRRPGEYALWLSKRWGDVEFTAQLRCDETESNTARDAILIFGYQDDTHFYYVHLAGRADSVHNAIMLVNGKDRQRIDLFDPAHPSKPALTDRQFHHVKIVRDVSSGSIKVYLDNSHDPILHAEDKTFLKGLLGVGSFDDTASFHSLAAKGETAN